MSVILLTTVHTALRIATQAKRRKARRSRRRAGLARTLWLAARRLFARFFSGLAQERIHRAAIERELYQGRYRHASKCDDDLPIAR